VNVLFLIVLDLVQFSFPQSAVPPQR